MPHTSKHKGTKHKGKSFVFVVFPPIKKYRQVIILAVELYMHENIYIIGNYPGLYSEKPQSFRTPPMSGHIGLAGLPPLS